MIYREKKPASSKTGLVMLVQIRSLLDEKQYKYMKH